MLGMSAEQDNAKPVPTGPSPVRNRKRIRRRRSWTFQLNKAAHVPASLVGFIRVGVSIPAVGELG